MNGVSSSRLPCGELSAANGLFCADGNLQHVVTPQKTSLATCASVLGQWVISLRLVEFCVLCSFMVLVQIFIFASFLFDVPTACGAILGGSFLPA